MRDLGLIYRKKRNPKTSEEGSPYYREDNMPNTRGNDGTAGNSRASGRSWVTVTTRRPGMSLLSGRRSGVSYSSHHGPPDVTPTRRSSLQRQLLRSTIGNSGPRGRAARSEATSPPCRHTTQRLPNTTSSEPCRPRATRSLVRSLRGRSILGGGGRRSVLSGRSSSTIMPRSSGPSSALRSLRSGSLLSGGQQYISGSRTPSLAQGRSGISIVPRSARIGRSNLSDDGPGTIRPEDSISRVSSSRGRPRTHTSSSSSVEEIEIDLENLHLGLDDDRRRECLHLGPPRHRDNNTGGQNLPTIFEERSSLSPNPSERRARTRTRTRSSRRILVRETVTRTLEVETKNTESSPRAIR